MKGNKGLPGAARLSSPWLKPGASRRDLVKLPFLRFWRNVCSSNIILIAICQNVWFMRNLADSEKR